MVTAPPRPVFMRTREAAGLLGLSPRTLEKHRTCGTGPKFRKIGGCVIYALTDIEAWTDDGASFKTDGRRTRGHDPWANATQPDLPF